MNITHRSGSNILASLDSPRCVHTYLTFRNFFFLFCVSCKQKIFQWRRLCGRQFFIFMWKRILSLNLFRVHAMNEWASNVLVRVIKFQIQSTLIDERGPFYGIFGFFWIYSYWKDLLLPKMRFKCCLQKSHGLESIEKKKCLEDKRHQ